jgi:DNA end-binding protein Ku
MARSKKPARKPKAAQRATNGSSPSHGRARPAWQGHLRLSLVSCPVALYSATTRSADISFHLINPKTGNRIRMIPTDPASGPVPRAKLVRGFEIARNEYVTVTDEDLEAVKLDTTSTIEIERFVDAATIDRLFWNDPYFLVPDGSEGTEAYAVIREAMAAENQIALGRVVMHTRERLLAIEPRDRGLIAYTLRMRDEVLDPAAAFKDLPKAKADKRMIDIATRIIEQQEGPFDPESFRDRYEEALRALIRRKQKGQKPISAPPPEDTKVVDLMAALRKSLKAKRGGTGTRPANENRRRARG